MSSDQSNHSSELGTLLDRVEQQALSRLSVAELGRIPELHRWASSRFAELESTDPASLELRALRRLVEQSHAVLYRDIRASGGSWWRRALDYLIHDSPRAIREEWRLVLGTLFTFYALAALSFVAVRNDLEAAFTFAPPALTLSEISQLRETEEGQPFRGNFTFGRESSPGTSGWILAHNISLAILFFGSALVPPLFVYLLATNAFMVGVYTAVAWHWDQAWSISSILWCHGTLELQMFVLASTAGLVLARAVIAPAPWSRSRAIELAGMRAWALFAPIFPFLVAAGILEGFVSPHASTIVRAATALASLAALGLWIGLGGRARHASSSDARS